MARNGQSSNKHHHKHLDKEAERIKKNCEDMGIFITWNEATAIVAEKSARGRMYKNDIINFVKSLRSTDNVRRILG